MKNFMLTFYFTILIASTVASAGDFCIAKRELLPYSPFIMFSVDCNGVKIKETSLFGRGLDQKFEIKLKESGLNVIMRFENQLLISKKNREDLDANEICLLNKVYDMNRSFLNCDSGQSLTLNSSRDSAIIEFANSYNFEIIQRANSKNGFYILIR